jgi:hypothetical protein
MLEISKGGSVSATHGGYQYLSRGFAVANQNCEFYAECGCAERCQVIDSLAAEMETDLMNLPHIEATDLYLVRQFVKLMVFQIVVDRWLLRHDIILEKEGQLTMQPVFNVYFQMVNSSQRLGDRLGLTPVSRKELQKKHSEPSNDLATALAEISEERKALELEKKSKSPSGLKARLEAQKR